MVHHSGMDVPRERSVTFPSLSFPRRQGIQNSRDVSAQARSSLEYWIARSEPGDDFEVVFGSQKGGGYRFARAG
jgi:hypothetical protein